MSIHFETHSKVFQTDTSKLIHTPLKLLQFVRTHLDSFTHLDSISCHTDPVKTCEDSFRFFLNTRLIQNKQMKTY